jgi:hypothetical protein
MIDDVLGGTRRMREQATTYLPQNPLESTKAYQARVERTELYNGLEATLYGLTGLAFRSPPQLEEGADKAIAEDMKDVDQAGTSMPVFARELFEDGLAHGTAGILVDFPAVEGTVTKARELKEGLRPYWVRVKASDIVNWRQERINGKLVFTLLVIKETYLEPDGAFGAKEGTRYRVFKYGVAQPAEGETAIRYAVTWELWTRVTANGKYEISQGPHEITGPTEIPFAPYHAGRRKAELWVRPPLEGLAYTNIAHFQVRADHRNSMHYASSPILFGAGFPDESSTQAVGSSVMIRSTDPSAKLGWVEHTGNCLAQTRTEQQDLKTEMAEQGLAMLARETRAAETAESKGMDREDQESRLIVAVNGEVECLNQALKYHAQYRKVAKPPTVKMKIDDRMLMDAATMAAYQNMRTAGDLSVETMWEIFKENRVLPETFDADKEMQRLADEALRFAPAGEIPSGGEDDA